MPSRAHLPPAERRLLSRLHLLLNDPGLLHGSLHRVARRCGKEGCHCAEGEGHPGFVLRVVGEGGQRSVYVPASWAERVRSWIEQDRQIRALLLELSGLYVTRLRERKEE